jgi:hypothetical protein
MPQNDLKVVYERIYSQKIKNVLVTQAEFSRHIGTSPQYVHKLIRLGKLAVIGGRINLGEGLGTIAARPGRHVRAGKEPYPSLQTHA